MRLSILRKLLIILILTFSILIIEKKIAFCKIEIIFPSDNIIVFSKNIHIIGRMKKKCYPKIVVNTDKVYKVNNLKKIKTNDGIFYIFCQRIKLKTGFNLIEIETKKDFQTLIINYLSGNKHISDKPKIKSSFFHMNEKIIYCKLCHNFTSNKDCLKCHIEKKYGKYIHGPVATWQCFVCHDKNNYFTVNQPLSVKCLRCHQEFSDSMYNAKFAHAPSVTGNCILCHTPHSSKNKYFLYQEVNKICATCHEDKLTGFHILKKFEKKHNKLKCISCHNPHYGESKFLFIKKIKKKRELCLQCHRKLYGM